MKKIYLYSLSMWMLFVIIAILNGTFRELYLSPNISEYSAHVLSTLILSSLILLLSYFFLKSTKTPYTLQDTWWIGALWLSLTILFEFVFGHYVMHHLWATLLSDYNFLKGRLWCLVLISTFSSPYICSKYFIK